MMPLDANPVQGGILGEEPEKEQIAPSGVLIVDKPQGFTSFDVVAKLRGILKTRKIGHSGTLDPMATGVLPVFVGGATKAADMQLNQEKTYFATILFGQETDTGDITGEVTAKSEPDFSEAQLKETLAKFTGKSEQLPPMYSAVKIDGVPLYKLARAGKTAERKPREIEIFSADYVAHEGEDLFSVRVHCSKGTYIRTLAQDIGAALGTHATLAALRREGAGVYTIENAKTLTEIEALVKAGGAHSVLTPVESVFSDWQRADLSEKQADALRHGVKMKTQLAVGRYAVYCGGRFLGTAQAVDGVLRVIRLFEW